MKFSEFFTSKDNINLDKKTLVILRWIAITGQFIAINLVYFYLNSSVIFLSEHFLNILSLIIIHSKFYETFQNVSNSAPFHLHSTSFALSAKLS